jgi:hypothetical protein
MTPKDPQIKIDTRISSESVTIEELKRFEEEKIKKRRENSSKCDENVNQAVRLKTSQSEVKLKFKCRICSAILSSDEVKSHKH